jgi:tetratricopeptide (TPR) repeat protein
MTSFADEADPKTKAFFDQGKTLFQAGRFEEALAAFTEAYNRTGEPKLLFNLAASAEGMGDRERAKAYYQVYLEELPDAEDAEEVKNRIERLSLPMAPAAQKPDVEPQAAEQTKVTSKTDNVDAKEYYSKKEEKKKVPLWPPFTMGLGGMVLASGMITAILAKSKYDGLESTCKPNCSDDQIAPAKASAIAADVQFAVGGVAATAGIIGFFLLRKKYKENANGVEVKPQATVNGGGMVVEGSF